MCAAYKLRSMPNAMEHDKAVDNAGSAVHDSSSIDSAKPKTSAQSKKPVESIPDKISVHDVSFNADTPKALSFTTSSISDTDNDMQQAPIDLPPDITQMDLLKKIWAKVANIDSMDVKLNQVIQKVANVENEQNIMKNNIEEHEKSLNFMSSELDQIKQSKADAISVDKLQKEVEAIKTRMLDTSNRMRRNNVVIHNLYEGWEQKHGVKVASSASGGQMRVSMEKSIEKFLRDELGVNVELDAAHRTGTFEDGANDDAGEAGGVPRTKKQPRMIHARCLRRTDRDRILFAAAANLKDKSFNNQRVFICDDVDPVTRVAHKELVPIMKGFRDQGYFAFIPWSVPRVIRFKRGDKDSNLPMETYRLKDN